MTPELSRTVRTDTIGRTPRDVEIEATAGECAAIATRFGLVKVSHLSASVSVVRAEPDFEARGHLTAAVVQVCVATAEPVPARIETPFTIRFRPQPAATAEEELELAEDELDVMFIDGALIDLGEAVAQTLALSLDPFPRAMNAAEVLAAAGVVDEDHAGIGPFGALAGLKEILKR